MLTRFKTIGYSCMAYNKDEDGLFCLILNEKESVVRANQSNIITNLHKIFNNDQSLTINLKSIKTKIDDQTEVIFFITQRQSATSVDNSTKRITSLQIFEHLNKEEAASNNSFGGTSLLGTLRTQPTVKQQLEQIKCINFYPLVTLSEDQIKKYLETVPSGLNPILWEQAKKNNPNSSKLLPVQIIGFPEINKRFRQQDQETKAQKARLIKINSGIETLNERNQLLRMKIEQFKNQNDDLQQRLLRV
jgi:nuclear pore complex protein Nup54